MTDAGTSAPVQAFVISAGSSSPSVLVATLHLPHDAVELGIVMVTGGNQVRCGSHRQFLKLARRFAAQGNACLRFDLPGLGDSSGELARFDANDAVLRGAIDALMLRAPSVKRVVLWGLCDGATAAALYAVTDARVAGLVLANPWVRTGQIQAQTLVKTYYRRRLVSPVFWSRLLRGQVGVARGAKEWLSNWRTARGAGDTNEGDLPARLKQALSHFAGRIEVIIAERDLTGQEFLLVAGSLASPHSIRITCIEGADHTFSSQVWHQQLEDVSLTALGN